MVSFYYCGFQPENINYGRHVCAVGSDKEPPQWGEDCKGGGGDLEETADMPYISMGGILTHEVYTDLASHRRTAQQMLAQQMFFQVQFP